MTHPDSPANCAEYRGCQGGGRGGKRMKFYKEPLEKGHFSV